MSEWSSYTFRDLLLFTTSTYHRLFETYNAAIWPAQVLAVALGIAILLLLRRGTPGACRWICGILAAGWLWTGVAFLAKRYAPINWSAMDFAWAFGVEAAMLFGLGVMRGGLSFPRPTALAGRVGLGISLFALFAEPFIAPLLRRSFAGSQLFLLCPDPTAIGTLGLLVLARAHRRWPLMVIPTVWCLYTAVFLFAMKSPDWWIPPLAAVMVTTLTFSQRKRAEASREPA